ncbi:TIR domain-containing protein [Rhizobium sp. FY34]|uniref:toll/interleukin-1 receptor domain-containing protein n=1 Tax=Rhizobium sp. FY34 TaxID=2562309 RepID=UPI0010C034C6|nr:TIR domain-containing protein [Rhizobium sp. FY34]
MQASSYWRRFTPSNWHLSRVLWDALVGYDVFVSYAWVDGRPYAHALATALRNAGYRCFLDDSEMPGGTELGSALSLALRRSAALVVVTTPGALASSAVRSEVDGFAARGRHVVPVFLDPSLRTNGTGSVLSLLRQRIWLAEDQVTSTPSAAVITRLIQTFRFVKRARLRSLAIGIVAFCFATLIAAAFLQSQLATTERQLKGVQALTQRQPTEALMLLAEAKRRWFSDPSILQQLEAFEISSSPTVWRYVVGDAVSGVAWLSNDRFAVASANGMGYVWDTFSSEQTILPARTADTPEEHDSFAAGTIPLSDIRVSPEGNFLATIDWRHCLRIFPINAIASVTANSAVRCINSSSGEDSRHPFAISPTGKIAIVRQNSISILSAPSSIVQIPMPSRGEIKDLAFDKFDHIHVRYSNNILVSVDKTRVMKEGTSLSLGQCSDGRAWSIAEGDELVFVGRELTQPAIRLSGNAPYLISPNCAGYIDGRGDLFSLLKPSQKLKEKFATDWQYDGNMVRVSFSDSGNLAAVAQHDGTIQVLEVNTGAQRSLLGHTQRVFDMAFSPDEQLLLTGSLDGTARIFEVNSGFAHEEGEYPGAEAVYSSVSNDKPIVSDQAYEAIEDLEPSQPLFVNALDKTTTGKVEVRADWRAGKQFFLADGDTQYTAVCSAFGCPAGSEVRRLRLDLTASGNNVQARATEDGRFLAVLDIGNAIHVFDLSRPSDAPLYTLRDDQIRSATFDSSGQRLFMLRGDRLVILSVGAVALKEALQDKIRFCLSAEERMTYLNEWKFLASWIANRCRSER